ncbi:MAG: hypothetical protein S4CHLAM45_01790 [Chlamydiales bacterium]|nr:hypothetical protein [Chlamydiales bacterium]MCH9619498.1 hypothetical protein [Chlamydiales bacterium]MCH9622302.1 hypothetical protein [Chlamydiales bacterium]
MECKTDQLLHFEKNGWIVVDLINLDPLHKTISALEHYMHEILAVDCPLADYHLHAEEDKKHFHNQTLLTQFYREKKFGRAILTPQLPFFQKLIGTDLLIQSDPYLRLARPSKTQDNVGYHRDTFYGGSPFEVSVIIPFVDCTAPMSLSVLSCSHILPEEDFPTTQTSSNIEKGSAQHKMGFLYSPKTMDPSIEEKMEPIPLKVGQILIFSLSIVHGCVVNKGSDTRWSSDMRLVNPLAPVNFDSRPNYYESFHQTPVTACAKRYFEANGSSPLLEK